MTKRQNAAGADAVERRDLAGRHLQAALHHARETRQWQIPLGCRRRQKLDVLQFQAALRQRIPNGIRRHLRIRVNRSLLAVDSVMALRDPVLPQNFLAESRRLAADLPEPGFHLII